jgi:hypothetical protein
MLKGFPRRWFYIHPQFISCKALPETVSIRCNTGAEATFERIQLTFYTSIFLFSLVYSTELLHRMASKTWEEIAKSMQRHRADTIAAVEPAVPDPPANPPLNVTGIPTKLLSEEVVSITDKLPEQLVSDLASGKLTSTAVTKAFLQRAGLASKLVNCCTELLPERALERAKYLDEYYSKNRKPIGPLHGLPISVCQTNG